jgi:hypothetical protein
MSDWQPKESAPKDGTRILVATTERVIGLSFWLPASQTWWSQQTGRSMRDAFTHWMPIPAPPQEPPHDR